MKTLTGLKAGKKIVDPVHGEIPVTEVELAVISSPIFQRLRSVTHLSLASLVFPGATHNRFQHSLGTLQVMDRLLFTLKSQDIGEITDEVIQVMRLAALLHDCGHLPFSHSLEKRGSGIDHETLGSIIIEKSSIAERLSKHGIAPTSISSLIQQQPVADDPFFSTLTKLLPLIHSNADADRMDYLLRDGYFTGVPFGRIDFDRICNSIRIENDQVCFLDKAQDALEGFLFSRYQMYKIVYNHKTVICYDLILNKLLDFIEEYSDKVSLPFRIPKMDEFLAVKPDWFDSDFLSLNEGTFFESARALIKSTELKEPKRSICENFYKTIITRTPVKNAFLFTNLAEVEKGKKKNSEFCEKEKGIFAELSSIPGIIDHWSFLRYDPSKPINLETPIEAEIADEQDYTHIKLLKKSGDERYAIVYLQSMPNSVVKSLARHHRVLISYYHNNAGAREKINEIASKVLSLENASDTTRAMQ